MRSGQVSALTILKNGHPFLTVLVDLSGKAKMQSVLARRGSKLEQ